MKTAFPSKRLAMLTLTISHQRRGLNGTVFKRNFCNWWKSRDWMKRWKLFLRLFI
ncbi:hypothetical protein [Brevibacillus formosus]|uniref:hypothetical protein n=1 Tax=Brevibacillus formosus TaxID=54913 RepID=UPI003D1C1706